MSQTPSVAPPSAANRVILQIDRLSFAYPQRPLFDKLSLTICAGVTLVRGDDGSGKSTLLRLLAGDLPAQGGGLVINGVALHHQPAEYRKQVFWTDARTQAFDQLTPEDYWSGVNAGCVGFDTGALSGLVDGLSLAAHIHKPLYMLSTGSRRKVWLAAAFASNAPVTLIDDPFAALDKPSIAHVVAQLREVASRQQRAVVLADYTAPPDVPLRAVIELPG